MLNGGARDAGHRVSRKVGRKKRRQFINDLYSAAAHLASSDAAVFGLGAPIGLRVGQEARYLQGRQMAHVANSRGMLDSIAYCASTVRHYNRNIQSACQYRLLRTGEGNMVLQLHPSGEQFETQSLQGRQLSSKRTGQGVRYNMKEISPGESREVDIREETGSRPCLRQRGRRRWRGRRRP